MIPALTDEDVVQIAREAVATDRTFCSPYKPEFIRDGSLDQCTTVQIAILGARAVAARLSGGAGDAEIERLVHAGFIVCISRMKLNHDGYQVSVPGWHEVKDGAIKFAKSHSLDTTSYYVTTPPAELAVVPDMAAREAEILQDYQWGNLTPLGVANHLRRAGFKMTYAIEKANALTPETKPAALADDLVERLNRKRNWAGALVLDNPDGPEAAARITDLQAEVGRVIEVAEGLIVEARLAPQNLMRDVVIGNAVNTLHHARAALNAGERDAG